MGGASGIQTLLDLCGQRIGGQRNDRGEPRVPWRYTLLRFPPAYRLRRGIAVHDGHLHIHQHQIVGPGFKFFDGYLPVFRYVDLIRGLLQVGLEQQTAVGGIVHQEYPHAGTSKGL